MSLGFVFSGTHCTAIAINILALINSLTTSTVPTLTRDSADASPGRDPEAALPHAGGVHVGRVGDEFGDGPYYGAVLKLPLPAHVEHWQGVVEAEPIAAASLQVGAKYDLRSFWINAKTKLYKIFRFQICKENVFNFSALNIYIQIKYSQI